MNSGLEKRFPSNQRVRPVGDVPGIGLKSEMFPFNPEGSYRHPEGWVNYGASWCLSLAYLAFDEKARTNPDP